MKNNRSYSLGALPQEFLESLLSPYQKGGGGVHCWRPKHLLSYTPSIVKETYNNVEAARKRKVFSLFDKMKGDRTVEMKEQLGCGKIEAERHEQAIVALLLFLAAPGLNDIFLGKIS